MLTVNKKGHPVIKAEANIIYELAVGSTWSRFFDGLKREKIWGSRCPRCLRVLVPARLFCPRCYMDMEEWVEVADQGEVACWSLTNYEYFGQPTEPPFVSALIRLDGADNELIHLVGGFDLHDLETVRKHMRIGTRVKAVWRKSKQGSIMDIVHFRPVLMSDQETK